MSGEGSGLDAGVSLRQPYGLEGFVFIVEELHSQHFFIAEGPNYGGSSLDLDSARRSAPDRLERHHYAPVVVLEEAFGLPHQGPPCVEVALHDSADCFAVSVDAGIRASCTRHVDLGPRVDEFHAGIRIPAVEGLDPAAQYLYVLLRHELGK
jgi:hypothetical protein